MRILYKSQMLNRKKIKHHLETEWAAVSRAMPKLDPDEVTPLQSIFLDNWDITLELFRWYTADSSDGQMVLEEFRSLLEEARVFPARDLSALASRIHRRCLSSVCPEGSTGLSLSAFIVALLLCAQSRHNDTLEQSSGVTCASDALDEVFVRNLIPLAERFEFDSVLKEAFCSSEVLDALREFHNDMFAVFNKYAMRSRELPSTMKAENMGELLYDAGMLDREKDMHYVKSLLSCIRRGSIFGTPPRPASDSDSMYEDPVGPTEYSFSEMVEGLCWSSFYKLRGSRPEEGAKSSSSSASHLEYAGSLSVQDCFVQGLEAALASMNKSVPAGRK